MTLLDATQARRTVESEVPGLSGLQVRPVGEGEDHQVFAVGDEWLVRFAESVRIDWLRREVEVLKAVGETVASGVPRPEFYGGPSAKHPFVAYRRIPGIAVDACLKSDPVGLACDLGRMLGALHRVDPARIPPTPANWESLTFDRERTKLMSARSALEGLLAPELARRAAPYLAGAMPVPARERLRRLTRSDMKPDHVIVDPANGRLNGLIDFTDAMVADPLVDFVGLIPLGGRRFVDLVIASYDLPLGAGFDTTLEWLSRTLALRWLADAAIENPAATAKHVRWVELAFS
jgi:aminoglycoside phosphotransferase (APT) family kinase protein